VDEDVVATKLERAHEYTNDLAEMRGIPKEEYVRTSYYSEQSNER
jgi:hypothetical protein